MTEQEKAIKFYNEFKKNLAKNKIEGADDGEATYEEMLAGKDKGWWINPKTRRSLERLLK